MIDILPGVQLLTIFMTQATDGNALQDVILECKRGIVKEWGDGAVLFLISRIGGDPRAVKFLESLEMNVEIKNMVYCSKKKLDDLVASGEHKNIASVSRRLLFCFSTIHSTNVY